MHCYMYLDVTRDYSELQVVKTKDADTNSLRIDFRMGWNILVSVNGQILHKEKITILGGNKM